MGARMLRDQLARQGIAAGRRHIRTLMLRMGIEAAGRRSRAPARPHRGTRSTRICCASWRSTAPTRSGRWTRPTFPWREGSSTSPPWWTWPRAGCSRTRWRSRWKPIHAKEVIEQAFARYGVTRDRQHRPGQPVHGRGVHRCRAGPRLQAVHGRARRLARQRLRRATVAQRQVRTGVPEGLRRRERGARGLARYIEFYNMRRPHSTLDGNTPDEFYFASLPAIRKAA